jgi:uncharacterized membrane protein YbhN (UPF0104 family)
MRKWFLRAAVSASVVALLLLLIPLDLVWQALVRVSPWVWLASVVIFFGGHYLNALKLRLLLGSGPEDAHVTSACVRAQYAGLVANLGLPGLAGGDVVRAAYLAPAVGLARITVASIADRLIDTATIVALVAIALPLAGMPPGVAGVVERAWLWIAIGLPAAVLLGLVARRIAARPAVAAKLGSLKAAFQARRGAVVTAIAISFAVQSAFVMTNVWLARQVGVTTGLASWFVAWPLSKLIAVLPISLGGIGVREATLVSLLAPYGAPREAVLASGILWQAVLIVTGIVGLIVTQLLIRTTPVRAASGGNA